MDTLHPAPPPQTHARCVLVGAQRQRQIERFKEEPGVTVMLLSLKCGVGLNLTVANRVVLVDPW